MCLDAKKACTTMNLHVVCQSQWVNHKQRTCVQIIHGTWVVLMMKLIKYERYLGIKRYKTFIQISDDKVKQNGVAFRIK